MGVLAEASIVNFVVLTSAASSTNSGVFSTSRILFGLAQEANALKQVSQLSNKAVPVKGLFFTCCCLCLAIILIYFIPNVMWVFVLITTVSAILFMFIWSMILCSYLAYRKKQPHLHQTSIYKMLAGAVGGTNLVCGVIY